jgi:hypothetical protein
VHFFKLKVSYLYYFLHFISPITFLHFQLKNTTHKITQPFHLLHNSLQTFTLQLSTKFKITLLHFQSLSDESFKAAAPVIPRSVPPTKSDSYQNGLSNLKDVTFGSTADSHYKQLYEKTLDENERLRKQLEDAKTQARSDSLLTNGANAFITVRKNFNNANSNSSGGSHSPSPTATQSTGNSTHLEETDRRAYERKIAELEYELQVGVFVSLIGFGFCLGD